MLFTSPVFLFLFLPAVIGLYFLCPRRLRNGLLLTASLFFYAWGEREYVQVLLASIAVNYVMGLCLDRAESPSLRRLLLAVTVVADLGLLIAFKYANFLADNLNAVLIVLGRPGVTAAPVHLPLGISFFTFHGLSYVIDVYRRQARALRNPVDFALYIALFPQAIAGPIVRYHEIADQFRDRTTTIDGFAEGVRRFIVGLAKKMLLANTVARPADAIFDMPSGAVGPGLAWLAVVCYSLQIYFDFSAYSDMAVGLARMFGFRFPENFAHPYASRSVTEFWRRWHMSLSAWFRDYLYVPLGGNRRGRLRTYFNLAAVFLLCGLWHGASWSFVVWGAFYGCFLILEKLGLEKLLGRLWRPLQHLYLLLVVLVGWTFFRAATLGQAFEFLRAMSGLGGRGEARWGPGAYLNTDVVLALVVGAVASLPVLQWARQAREALRPALGRMPRVASAGGALLRGAGVLALAVLFAASLAVLAGGTYNPFIYFRF